MQEDPNTCSTSGFIKVLFAAAAKSLQSCPTLSDPRDGSPPGSPSLGFSRQEHWQVGCHFLLQCRKVKSESEVAQSCPTFSNPMDCSLPGSSVHGIFPGKSTGVGCHCLLRKSSFPIPNPISPNQKQKKKPLKLTAYLILPSSFSLSFSSHCLDINLGLNSAQNYPSSLGSGKGWQAGLTNAFSVGGCDRRI